MSNILTNKDKNLNKRLKKISFILSNRVDEIKDNKPEVSKLIDQISPLIK